jgi:hypothetical protein
LAVVNLRAREIDEDEREALTTALAKIETAAQVLAEQIGIELGAELDPRGRYPVLALRARGLTTPKPAPVEHGRDM